MRRVRLAALASLSVLATSPALAQAPQVEKNVSMAMALAIIQGAIEQCTKDGYKVSVVIVDKAGNVESLKSISFKVDQTAPKFSACAANPPELWPPNHKMVNVTVSVVLSDGGSGPAGGVTRSRKHSSTCLIIAVKPSKSRGLTM